MSIKVRTALTSIFSSLEIPTHRARANRCYSQLREINSVALIGKSLAAEQLEWLTDEIADKTKEMYPDRYTDLSTPVLRQHLDELRKEKEQVLLLLALLEGLEIETSIRLPVKSAEVSSYENELEGM